MERLRKAEAQLVRLETALLVVILTVMISLSFLQVVLRHFGAGLLWADTLSRYLVLWLGFLGAALAASQGKHFAWEAAAERPGKGGAALRLIAMLAAAAVTVVLARASWTFFADERQSASVLFNVGSVAVPSWTAALAIPTGFMLVLAHLLVRAAQAAEEFRR